MGADICCHREKKRGADEPAEIPESKKPRLDSGGVVEDAAEPPAETESVAEAATKNPAPPKAGKQKKGEGGGSFKENPYTFLPPDDPSIVSCVYVSLPIHPFHLK
jgi:multisite-specific tRNA:(cytosine-C5)-methyltransferase